ncbi:hypothetical protein ABOZ73_06610 [Caulobacter sp. 73W]|uniref:Uncharacterized protein n=1 Tax=Caulobacter sp. 73W TaxID=3161137 RepID=A0AB39KX16_9CAUL
MATREIPHASVHAPKAQPTSEASERPALRARDLRAIAFLLGSTALILLIAGLVLENLLAALALTAAYAVWLATRPRMIRVARRLRGERVEHISYYSN